MSDKLKTNVAFSFLFFLAGGCGAIAQSGTAEKGAPKAPSSSSCRSRKEVPQGVGGVEASEDSLQERFRVCPSLGSATSWVGDCASGSSDSESTTSLSGAIGNFSGSGGIMHATLRSYTTKKT